MTWGEQNTEAEAHEQLSYACVDRGINFIDTAEMYPVPTKPVRNGGIAQPCPDAATRSTGAPLALQFFSDCSLRHAVHRRRKGAQSSTSVRVHLATQGWPVAPQIKPRHESSPAPPSLQAPGSRRLTCRETSSCSPRRRATRTPAPSVTAASSLQRSRALR